MKKIILITTLALSTTVSAYAGQQNGIEGLVLGAGSGAVMGQVIGGNTESTLIGTAVGSMVGYLIGNEINRDYRGYNQPARHHRHPVVHRQKHVTYNNYYSEPAVSTPPPKQRRRCKEAEILGTVNGRAKKIYGTVCKTSQGWELVSEEPSGYGYNSNMQNSRWKPRKKISNRHYRKYEEQSWVHHRY